MQAEDTVVAAEAAALLPAWLWVMMLMAGAILAALAEVFLVTGGIIGVMAAILAIWAVVEAFAVHPLFGWALLAALPFIAWWIIRFGLQHILQSAMVPQSSIDDHAGAAHAAAEHGVSIGTLGTMVTTALPSGSAAFAGHQLDVHSVSGALEVGESVRVVAMNGPVLQVERHDDN
jgi:membrane-bound ClpP family serine protease